ncbi:MAG: hypothetical protein ACFNYD_05095 [Bacteroides sp.]
MNAKRTQSNTDLLEALRSPNTTTRRAAMAEIRSLEDDSLVPMLVALLADPAAPEEAAEAAYALLCDARYSSLVEELGQALAGKHSPATHARLLSITWQNRLNFAPLLPRMIAALSGDDLQVAIEASTGIEMAIEVATIEELKAASALLKDTLPNVKHREIITLVKEAQLATGNMMMQRMDELKGER